MTSQNLIDGLQILAKYQENGLDTSLGGAGHDILYVAPDGIKVSAEDRAALEGLGFHESTEYGGWAVFV